MEGITIEQIGAFVAFLAAFVGGVAYLRGELIKWLRDALKSEFEGIYKKIDETNAKIDRVDTESCKNYLVRCLTDYERNKEIPEIERERFWEQYEHYISTGHNSYIKRKVEQLKADGIL